MDRRFEYRSLFWPILLIGVGVVWLLGNLGIIQPINFWQLLNLWPLLLIVIGLDMLIGRRSAVAGAIIGLLAVAAVIVLLVAGPRLGLPAGRQLQTERFTEPLGEAVSAQVNLDLSSPGTTVEALTGSSNLIDAQITHTGEIIFQVSGDREKTVSLDSRSGFNWNFSFGEQRWEIGLTPEIPLSLVVDGGSGSARLDLTGLMLADLNVDRGSGSFTILLPAAEQAYEAEIEGGSGSLDLTVPEGTSVTLRLRGGSGSQAIHLPAGAALRLEVQDSGSGGVRRPSGLQQVEDGDGNDEGVWETQDYDQAGTQILIVIEELGSGGIRIGN